MTFSDKTKPMEQNPQKAGSSCIWSWIAISLIIICAAALRWHLVAMPFERDEGEYAYIAQQLLHGVPPYESAYSMKLPGIYAIYALFLAAFGQTVMAIHLGLIIFNAATIIVIFLLAGYMFGTLAGVAAAAGYAILSVIGTVLGFTANAEHFVLLPALVGILLVLKHSKNGGAAFVFLTALLFGIAFIIKQHGIFFAIFGGLYLLFSDVIGKTLQWNKIIKRQFVFFAGFILPYALVCLYYWHAGLFGKFWYWTFTYAHTYSAMKVIGKGLNMFLSVGRPILLTLPLIWLLALAGLASVFIRRDNRRFAVFVAGFIVFSFFALSLGFYFRPHYFLFICPIAAILAGAGFGEFGKLTSRFVAGPSRDIFIVLVGLTVISVCAYQHRYFYFCSPNDVCWLFYQRHPFIESLEIAGYIRSNSSSTDTIAVLGSEPQIYFYSGRRSATRYIYVYPLMEPHKDAESMRKEMRADIENARPAFIVFVNLSNSWMASPNTVTDYVSWANSYVKRYYDIVGFIDIKKEGAFYYWDNQAPQHQADSKDGIMVFKRK